MSRIDLIGQNGNDGLHYKEIGEDYIDKIRRTNAIPKSTWDNCANPIYPKKQEEKEFLNKLVEDHWKYIQGVLAPHKDVVSLHEIEYHYKTAMIHGWRHAKEYFTGNV